MSKVQICNRALSTYLGVSRINNLNEDTPQAEQCNLHYEDTLRELLELHWWVFAKGRVVLAELENDRPNEWAYRYSRPSAALAIRWVNTAEDAHAAMQLDRDPDTPREMMPDSIYSNAPGAVCEFTMEVTDPTKYPSYFKNALSAALAANMAMSLTEDIKKAQNAMSQAESKLDRAMALDERETPPLEANETPEYLRVRGVS